MENLNESFGTLSEAINGLVTLGYTHDFNIQDECIVCHSANIVLSPDDFQIDKVYRFEGYSDPEYQSILYAISSPTFGVKGTLVNGYGISSDETTSKLIAKLKTHHEPGENKSTTQDSTPQRPNGERVLNAPLVEMNLNAAIDQIKSEKAWKDNELTYFHHSFQQITPYLNEEGREIHFQIIKEIESRGGLDSIDSDYVNDKNRNYRK